jgi:hypothetical protein
MNRPGSASASTATVSFHPSAGRRSGADRHKRPAAGAGRTVMARNADPRAIRSKLYGWQRARIGSCRGANIGAGRAAIRAAGSQPGAFLRLSGR